MTKICCNTFPKIHKPRHPHASFPHFQKWLTAFEQDNQSWEPPHFDTFYRVQGPFQIKHAKSKINLQLFMFAAKLDDSTEYRLSSALKCTALVDSITPLFTPRGKPKQFRVIATLQDVDARDFYTYRVRELDRYPEQKVICYKPEAGDQLSMIYTPGIADLAYPGVIYQWISNNYIIPCYTPPADHNGNFLLCADKKFQIGFAVHGIPSQYDLAGLTFDSLANASHHEICCRITPCLFNLNNTFFRSFEDCSFYVNFRHLYHSIPQTDNHFTVFIGQISGCAKDRLLAQTRHFLCPDLSQFADLIPQTKEKNLAKFFAKDSLVQIGIHSSVDDPLYADHRLSYIQSIIGPTVPRHGLFPYVAPPSNN